MKRAAFVLLWFGCVYAQVPGQVEDLQIITSPFTPPSTGLSENAIVFSRVPRTIETFDVATETFGTCTRDPSNVGECLGGFDLHDRFIDTARLFGENVVGGGQLVLYDEGQEYIIHDCGSWPAPTTCLPLDASVSFDGTKIYYTVIYGEGFWDKNFTWLGQQYTRPSKYILNTTHARIFVADVSDPANIVVTAWPDPPPGQFDMGPIALPNGDVLFTSNRAGHLRAVLRGSHSGKTPVLQMWLADPDGSNPRFVGQQHTGGGALHPVLTPAGNVLYSYKKFFGSLPYECNNGTKQNFCTKDNQWRVARVNWDISNWQAVFGFHEGTDAHKAIHFLGVHQDSSYMATEYYRANNVGAGSIFVWSPNADGVEGREPASCGGSSPCHPFRPSTAYELAPWATSRDGPSLTDGGGNYTGKLRTPSGTPDGKTLLTFADGVCSVVTGSFGIVNSGTFKEYGCWLKIAKTTQPRSSTHPSDLEIVYSDQAWHAFDARPVVPFATIHGGVPAMPAPRTTDAPDVCEFRSANARDVETTFWRRYDAGGNVDLSLWDARSDDFSAAGRQGNELFSNLRTQIEGVRFWKVIPITEPRIWHNTQSGYLGLFQAANGMSLVKLGDAMITTSDGSIRVQLPCNTPFVHGAITANGELVNRSQIIMALRPGGHVASVSNGEAVECRGCHLHSEERQPLAPEFSTTEAAGLPPVVISDTAAAPLEFNADVLPILQNRCGGCHMTGGTTDPILDLPGVSNSKFAGVNEPTHWRLCNDHRQELSHASIDTNFERPHASYYANIHFALDSVLYWAANNQRLDGRVNVFDGRHRVYTPRAEHDLAMTGITPSELETLRDWLEGGCFADGG